MEQVKVKPILQSILRNNVLKLETLGMATISNSHQNVCWHLKA